MKYTLSLFLTYILSLLSCSYCNCQQIYSIPKQTITPFKILGPRSSMNYWNRKDTVPTSMTLNINEFEISSLITYGEYKEYLKTIKRDSSGKFYLSQTPDSSMCLPDTYKEYVSGDKYDNFPVMGISWDAAMNYCRWKTIQNNKDSVKYIYRLPSESEWLSAYSYLNKSAIKNDFNQNYSDWLLNSFDEDAWYAMNQANSNNWNNFDYVWFAKKNEPHILHRKCVIGDSYLFKMEALADYNYISYYSFHGYRHIGFRVLKEKVNTVDLVDSKGQSQPSIDMQIIKNWGLK